MRTRKDYLLGTSMAVGAAAMSMAMLVPAAAVAQEAQETTQVEEIVVVGSRIRRDNYNAPSPTQVVSTEEQLRSGYNSMTDILQSSSVTGGASQVTAAFGGYVTDGGPGANTLSLRGMGATRTLVMLNGRRVAPAGSRGSVGSADLNVLPTSMIERVEILKDGASSIYGSDAVAGVVNIITKNNVDGVTVSAQYNKPEDAKGQGATQRYSVVAGKTGDRFSLSGSLEYYERDELTLGGRPWARCPIDNYNDGSDFIDPMTGSPKCWTIDSGGVTINTLGLAMAGVNDAGKRVFNTIEAVAGPGATGTRFNRFRPNAAITTGVPGYEGVGAMDRDSFDPEMLKESLISGVEVQTAYLQGSYQLNALGNAEVYGEVLMNRRESAQNGFRQLTLDYAKGSPLVPDALAAYTYSADQGLNQGQDVAARAFIGFGNETSTQKVDFQREVIGLRGDLFATGWRYDMGVSYSKSDAEYVSNQILTDRLVNSLDVVADGKGGFVCASGAEGCVAAPALNADTLAGRLPADWVNYAYRPIVGTTKYEETVVSLGVDGPLFQLPAGEVNAFFGAEWREMKIDDMPDANMASGNIYNYSTATPTRGSDSVWEVFGEVEVPVLRDMRFAKELTLSGSFRYTDYDSYGDDSTYKIGAVYVPTDWLTLRASYGTSFRAPALFEQFVGATTGYNSAAGDPCNDWGNDSSPAVQANCAAEGIAADFDSIQSIEVVTKGGAESGLSAETSTNLTVGLVLRPRLPEGWGDLSFAVDYYEIEVKNGVDRVGRPAILKECYASSAADFAARNGYCQFVTRDPANDGLRVEDSYVNVATDVAKGLDYSVRYRQFIGEGHLTVQGTLSQMTERYDVLSDADPKYDMVGTLEQPEFSADLSATYDWGNWSVRYGVEWLSAMSENDYYAAAYGYDLPAMGYDVSVGDYFLHNASIRYESDNNWNVTVGVRNLFNEDPEYITTGVASRVGNAALYSGFDYVGRSGFINLSKSF
ncbi:MULTISPECIES: TonB-dependent receptor domain-containing protein [unclassified Brevundimonas]|uniref:TonB-dependent receptor domain-containing protein n=1 Tax=unclassified Brevundimonas TaxID=2622653 RepID=UPI0025C2DFE1|nr:MULTISPECIES: TonB-dependent receptor [unclassified Brevundimonas]